MRRVLLDENLPVQLRLWLTGVKAVTVEHMGWKGLRNGKLLRAATGRFDVLVTSDRLLVHQQRGWRALGVVVVTSNLKPALQRAADRIADACRAVMAGEIIEIEIDR